MVARKTCSQGIRLTSTLVPFSQSSITIEDIPTSMASPDVGPPSSLPYSFLQDSLHQACCCPWYTLQSQTGHWGLVDVQSSYLLLQILVRLQERCAQSVRSSLGTIRFSSSLSASTGAGHDCRRLLVQQGLSVEERIFQPDATGHQDLDEEEWPTFHATSRHFGLMSPPLVRTHPTDHQPYNKVLYQPTSIHIWWRHLPLWGQTCLFTSYLLSMPLLPIHWKYLSRSIHFRTITRRTILHCVLTGRISPSPTWQGLSLGSRLWPPTSLRVHPGKTKEGFSKWSTHHLLRWLSFSPYAQYPCQTHLPTHPFCLSPPLRYRRRLHLTVHSAGSACRCRPHSGKPRSGRLLYQYWPRQICPLLAHAPGFSSSKDECFRRWSLLRLSGQIQQSRWHH